MSATAARLPRMRARLLALGLLAAAPVQAQQASRDSAALATPNGRSWLDRLSVAAQYGVLRPAGGSELYALVDRALTPGADALRPKLVGGEVQMRVRGPWSVVLGAEAGSSTVGTVSRVQPAASAGAAPRQQTTLDLTSVQHLGASWRALRWRGGSTGAADRLRLVLGAGGGVARYRLRQWGTFVDAERALAFENDFRSTGSGGFGYASASAEVPLRRWVALQGVLRRQAGSAPMSADYASFDRLDLGGTRFSVGVLLHPASVLGTDR